MPNEQYLIAPINSGLDTSLKPFLIPDDAWAQLNNVYCFRGRIRKRWGSSLMIATASPTTINQLTSRLRVNVGTTDAITGNFSATVVPPSSTGAHWNIGAMFSVGNTIFTVYQANGATLTTGAATATFNTANGTLQIVGNNENPDTTIWFYPALPVMGLTTFGVAPINDLPTYAFDTNYAYLFSTTTGWSRSGSGVTPIWHGTDLNFFWTCNWVSTPGVEVMYVSNFYAQEPNGSSTLNDDPLWYLTSTTNTWASLQPLTLTAGNTILNSAMIFAFHDSLILVNTIEVDDTGLFNTQYGSRFRYSALQVDPTNAAAWLEFGQTGALGGGYEDAATDQQAVTGEFIKDRLIIYFERSTWEIVFTNNKLQPFRWQKLNTELGSESRFSAVPFDDGVMAVGSTGVHSCNGSNVQRIDTLIPDLIFDIKNQSSSTTRVAGIRDYYNELVYWTYPNDNTISTYPNKVLIYNYRNKTWAQFDDAITAWGYFEQSVAPTWANANSSWESYEGTWDSGVVQAQAQQIIAGNQQGFTFIVQQKSGYNAPALQITSVSLNSTTFVLTLVVINCTLSAGDYIYITGAQGSVNINGLSVPINAVASDGKTITCIMPSGFTLGGTYTGGGLISRISAIGMSSKQWNPYDKYGSNVALSKIDFAVTRTSSGEVTVDYYASAASNLSLVQGGMATGAIMGTSVLETHPYDPNIYPFEQYQDRLWHPVYFQSSGTCIQIYIYMQDYQLRNKDIWSDFFEIQGLVLTVTRTSSRLQ